MQWGTDACPCSFLHADQLFGMVGDEGHDLENEVVSFD